jgi:hypothetical protein
MTGLDDGRMAAGREDDEEVGGDTTQKISHFKASS